MRMAPLEFSYSSSSFIPFEAKFIQSLLERSKATQGLNRRVSTRVTICAWTATDLLAACQLVHQCETLTLVAATEEVEVVELVVELVERAPLTEARVLRNEFSVPLPEGGA